MVANDMIYSICNTYNSCDAYFFHHYGKKNAEIETDSYNCSACISALNKYLSIMAGPKKLTCIRGRGYENEPVCVISFRIGYANKQIQTVGLRIVLTKE